MQNPSRHESSRGARGFTLTELLVVVALIVLLIGTLFVAIGAATKRAQKAKTQFLMGSVSSGLAQFQTDFGYLPPVLGVRDAGAGPAGLARDVVRLGDINAADDILRQQSYLSYTTLAEYLIGYGNRSQDGYGGFRGGPSGPGLKELPEFGIRSPGSDGCWGAVDAPQPAYANFAGFYRARNPARTSNPPQVGNTGWNSVALEGKVYGPYIDQIDERLLGGLTGFDPTGKPLIVTADQLVPNFDSLPKCILDYWGEPIAYYRAPYGGNDLRSSVPKVDGGFLNLGDVYSLRPWELDADSTSSGAADAGGDDGTTASLKSAQFALRSNGPDRSFDASRRRDLGERNADNIVEVGK